MTRKLNLVHLLAIATTVMLLAAAGVGWDMSRRYVGLVYDFNARNTQRIADAGVADLAWREYAAAVSDIGRQVAQNAALRTALTDKDGAALKSMLADEFGRDLLVDGELIGQGPDMIGVDQEDIAEIQARLDQDLLLVSEGVADLRLHVAGHGAIGVVADASRGDEELADADARRHQDLVVKTSCSLRNDSLELRHPGISSGLLGVRRSC